MKIQFFSIKGKQIFVKNTIKVKVSQQTIMLELKKEVLNKR